MDCPYRGLVPYSGSPEDVRLFFGRTTERRVLIDNLTTARLSVVYGESGVGKSSVLNAGVASKLRADPESLVIVYNNWYADPVTGLTQKIREAAPDASAIPADSLSGALRALVALTNRRVLLILDQFEEYFQYHGGKTGPTTFADQFPAAVLDPTLDANFLLSIRSDSLAALDFFKTRIPNLLGNRIALRHLTIQGAREAIEQPIAEYNKDTPEAARIRLDSGSDLAARIIDQIGRKPEDAQDESAREVPAIYLQLVVSRLWYREMELKSGVLRAATLTELGGGERIYEEYFSSTLNRELDWLERRLAISLFQYLITPTGRKITISDKELSLYPDLQRKDFRPILKKLEKARILVTVPPPPGESPPPAGQPAPVYYQFAHDVLARAARQWRGEAADARQRTFRLLAWGAVAGTALLILLLYGLWREHRLTAIAQQETKKAQDALAAVSTAREEHADAEREVKQLQLVLGAQASPVLPTPVPADVRGIDLSKFSSSVDWPAIKAARTAFAFIRASQGTTLTDNRFREFWAAARSAGIRRGAYHVFRANQDPAEQARYFLGVVGALEEDDLPPAVDLTTLGMAGSQPPPPEVLSQNVVRWLQEVERVLRRTPLIYGASRQLAEQLTGDEIHTFPLWVADYGPVCRTPRGWARWTFWQYTPNGRLDGVAGIIDLNKFNGSLEDFARFR